MAAGWQGMVQLQQGKHVGNFILLLLHLWALCYTISACCPCTFACLEPQ